MPLPHPQEKKTKRRERGEGDLKKIAYLRKCLAIFRELSLLLFQRPQVKAGVA